MTVVLGAVAYDAIIDLEDLGLDVGGHLLVARGLAGLPAGDERTALLVSRPWAAVRRCKRSWRSQISRWPDSCCPCSVKAHFSICCAF
jgi:hypothetical protein